MLPRQRRRVGKDFGFAENLLGKARTGHRADHLPAGIHLRLCRSIQVEGAFGLLKNDFGFRRFLTRGRANIRAELFLLAMAFDLKKLWMKREQGRLQTRVSEKMTA